MLSFTHWTVLGSIEMYLHFICMPIISRHGRVGARNPFSWKMYLFYNAGIVNIDLHGGPEHQQPYYWTNSPRIFPFALGIKATKQFLHNQI